MRSVVVYSVLRILAFLLPFGVLMLFPAFQELPWLAALFAAVIGLALSMLFLRRPLDAVSAGLSERRTTRRVERDDADVEDAADDALRADAGGPTSAGVSAHAVSDPVTGAASIENAADAASDRATDAALDDSAGSATGDQPTKAQESSPA